MACTDGELLEAMQTGLIKRRDSKLLMISHGRGAARRAARPAAGPGALAGQRKTHRSGGRSDEGICTGSNGSLADDDELDDMTGGREGNPAPWITVARSTPPAGEHCRKRRSRSSTPAGGASARGRGCRPGRGKPASASRRFKTASRSGSASTSAASAPPPPSSGSTPPFTFRSGAKNDLLCRAFTADCGSRGLRQEVTFVVQDDEPVGLDGVRVEFDDERVVSDAGVMLVATLAGRLGIEALAGSWCGCGATGPGAANAGRKVMALLFAMVLGADSIDDTRRAARRAHAAGCWAAGCPAPSTLGTFLRAFTFGHVRQLDALLGRALERAWKAGAGPGDGPAGGRCRQLRRRGLRAPEAGRRLRLHAAAGLPPDPRHPGRHARDAAHPPAQGVGEHAEGDPALLRGADRARRARRRDRRQAAPRRLGVLEHQGLRAPGAGGLAVLDRRADDQDRPRRGRGDRRGRLAAHRLPRRRRGADRRDRLRRPPVDRQPHPPARRRRPSCGPTGGTSPSSPTAPRTSRSSRPSTASTPSSSRSSPTSKTRRWRTSPPATSTPTPRGPCSPRWRTTCCAGRSCSDCPTRPSAPPAPCAAGCSAVPGRLTRHARGWTLHLPARWPWHGDYINALNRIRALPAAA